MYAVSMFFADMYVYTFYMYMYMYMIVYVHVYVYYILNKNIFHYIPI
jgi:hypothetical protein